VKAFIFAIEKGFGLKTAASGHIDISSSDLSRDSAEIFDLDPCNEELKSESELSRQ
jgi:hypothetical protein